MTKGRVEVRQTVLIIGTGARNGFLADFQSALCREYLFD